MTDQELETALQKKKRKAALRKTLEMRKLAGWTGRNNPLALNYKPF